MKRTLSVFGPAALVAALAVGCASSKPPPELVDARQAFARAQGGPTSQMNPAGLYDAKQALNRAEARFKDDPGSAEARHLAYIAHRKTLMAESNARAMMAQRQEQQAQETLRQMEQQRLQTAEGKVEQFQDKLQEQQQSLMAERQARMEAEKRAKDTLDKLTAFVTVKEDQRGMVLTLSGSVLFAFGKTELMAPARQRLNDVADALKEMKGRQITVIGHTDNVGASDVNQRVSEQRAESVKDYLVSRGLDPGMIKTEGKGETQPIASNDSPSSRANNRRVEIVVEKVIERDDMRGGQPGMQQPGMQQPGMQQPGMQQPGMQQPGMQQQNMQQPQNGAGGGAPRR